MKILVLPKPIDFDLIPLAPFTGLSRLFQVPTGVPDHRGQFWHREGHRTRIGPDRSNRSHGLS